MSTGQMKQIAVTSVLFVLLNQLWLFGGNSIHVAEHVRGIVKGTAIVLAVMLFMTLAASTARGYETVWLGKTVRASALSVVVGFLLILIVGAVLNRGQFFHDGMRTPQLLIILVGLPFAAALLGAGVGAVARSFGAASGH